MRRLYQLLKEESRRPSVILLVGLVVIVRVVVAIVLWIALLMGVFLGYFTVPIFDVGELIMLYAELDVGLFAKVRDIERDREERQAFFRAQQEKKANELDHYGGLTQR
jgi:hypothetical protein